MDNLLIAFFEAHNADRNHHRRYEIRLGRDLFGEWTVSLNYGRTGRGGQEIRHTGPDPVQLQRVIRESLRRRLTAPGRIGCKYLLNGVSAAEGIDASFWLPADTMTLFLTVSPQGN